MELFFNYKKPTWEQLGYKIYGGMLGREKITNPYTLELMDKIDKWAKDEEEEDLGHADFAQTGAEPLREDDIDIGMPQEGETETKTKKKKKKTKKKVAEKPKYSEEEIMEDRKFLMTDPSQETSLKANSTEDFTSLFEAYALTLPFKEEDEKMINKTNFKRFLKRFDGIILQYIKLVIKFYNFFNEKYKEKKVYIENFQVIPYNIVKLYDSLKIIPPGFNQNAEKIWKVNHLTPPPKDYLEIFNHISLADDLLKFGYAFYITFFLRTFQYPDKTYIFPASPELSKWTIGIVKNKNLFEKGNLAYDFFTNDFYDRRYKDMEWFPEKFIRSVVNPTETTSNKITAEINKKEPNSEKKAKQIILNYINSQKIDISNKNELGESSTALELQAKAEAEEARKKKESERATKLELKTKKEQDEINKEKDKAKKKLIDSIKNADKKKALEDEEKETIAERDKAIEDFETYVQTQGIDRSISTPDQTIKIKNSIVEKPVKYTSNKDIGTDQEAFFQPAESSKRLIERAKEQNLTDNNIGWEIVIKNALNLDEIYETDKKTKKKVKLTALNIINKKSQNYSFCSNWSFSGFEAGFIYDLVSENAFIECKNYNGWTDPSTIPIELKKISGSYYYKPQFVIEGSSINISGIYSSDPAFTPLRYSPTKKLFFIIRTADKIFVVDVSSILFQYRTIIKGGQIELYDLVQAVDAKDFIYYNNKAMLSVKITENTVKEIFIKKKKGVGINKGLFYKPVKGQIKGGALVDTSNVAFGDTSTKNFKASSDFNEQLQKYLNDEPVPQLRSGSKADRDKYREEMVLYNKRKSEKQKEFMGKYKDDIDKANDEKFLEAGYYKDKNGRWQKPASLEDVPWLNDVAGAIGARNFFNKAIRTGETFYNKPNLENTIALGKTAIDYFNTGKNLAEKVADPKKLVKDIAIEQGKKLLGAGLNVEGKLKLYKNGSLLLDGKLLKDIKLKVKEMIKPPQKEHIVYTLEIKKIPKNKEDVNIMIKKYKINKNLNLISLKNPKKILIKKFNNSKLEKIHKNI